MSFESVPFRASPTHGCCFMHLVANYIPIDGVVLAELLGQTSDQSMQRSSLRRPVPPPSCSPCWKVSF